MNVLDLSDNRMFVLARRSRRLPHILLAIALVVAFLLLAQIGVVVVLLSLGISNLLLPTEGPPIEAASGFVFQLVVSFAPSLLLLWIWLHFFERRPFWTLGLERHGAIIRYMRGVLVGGAMFSAAVLLAALPGFVAPEQGNPQQQGLAALGGVLLVFVGWAVQGATEEILTRGWLMSVIGARYGPWRGVIVSSVVFALLHSLNPNLSILAVVNLFLFGLVAALYTLWEGGLWGVCAIHSVWNWTQGNIFGLDVSGQPATGGILFNLHETGPDLVTGGPFGPEAGLAVTAVLATGIIILGMLLKKDERRKTKDEIRAL